MSSADDPGAGLDGLGKTGEVADGQVHSQLVEALILVLIEKGVLTKRDALSIIQTVAQVQQGTAAEAGDAAPQGLATIKLLQRLYASFEALADTAPVFRADGQNVHQLRPPIHGGRPEFPLDD